jgi:hypothetical protein
LTVGGDDRLIRIQGFAVKGQHCFVTAVFVCDHLQIKAPLRFLVDTGNTHTTITQGTAERLGIDLSTLPETVNFGGIGGSAKGSQLAGIRIVFTTTDRRAHEEKLPFIRILKYPKPRSEEERKIMEQTPDLLGLDVLRRFTIKFERNLLYLEREDPLSQFAGAQAV